MPFALAAALVLCVQSQDTTSLHHGQPRHLAVTAEHIATAFRDAAAPVLLRRARAARLTQDSALVAYDAMSYHRMTMGLGFSALGRDRLAFRAEHAAHVQWQKGVGAHVELKGMRAAIPIASKGAERSAQRGMSEDMMVPIPYYPGYESLMPTGGMADAEVDDRQIIHPLAEGAEAYYFYETGDSLTIRLPNNTTVPLRELRVRPRRPNWQTIVGSFWFDTRSGQLVRAAYRLSVPVDVWTVIADDDPKTSNDIPAAIKGLVSPIKAEFSAATVEYALYDGRFWLPRLQTYEGQGQVSFVRVPFAMQHAFTYASVNARDSLPPIRIADGARARLDSLTSAQRRQRSDSLTAARRQQCDTSSHMTQRITAARDTSGRHENLRVSYRVPCNIPALANSPELPHSIFGDNESIFGSSAREQLVTQSLGLSAQPPWAPQRLVSHWGLDLTRYNRVEGLSPGLAVEQELGAGYVWRAVGRVGTADRVPNAELTLARTNLARTVSVAAYHRLVTANDWGNPLSFGGSLSALLFGRDEGFYYRAGGVELAGSRGANIGSGPLTWRLFAEQQRTAPVSNTLTFGTPWLANVAAQRGTYVGGAARIDRGFGLDPTSFRVNTALRLEAATRLDSVTASSQRGYARAAADLTASRGFGDARGALTFSAGSSAGELPPQRNWFLGGTYTIRGERPDTAVRGSAYWMTQAELARDFSGVRGIAFGDIGWTGDRRVFDSRAFKRPMRSVGVGMSLLDGLVRVDLARGIYPHKQWRLSGYVEARM